MTTSEIKQATDANWESIVEKSSKPVMVMFTSPTCPYCRQMDPVFEQYAKEYTDSVVFVKVDISKSLTIASRYGVMGTPTFKYLCNNRPIQELNGAVPPEMLKHMVDHGLKHGSSCAEQSTWIDPGYA